MMLIMISIHDISGSVDFDEFLLLMSRKMTQLDVEQELLEAFSVFDKDGELFSIVCLLVLIL